MTQFRRTTKQNKIYNRKYISNIQSSSKQDTYNENDFAIVFTKEETMKITSVIVGREVRGSKSISRFIFGLEKMKFS